MRKHYESIILRLNSYNCDLKDFVFGIGLCWKRYIDLSKSYRYETAFGF